MQISSACWLRADSWQAPVALLTHSAGVTAFLTAPTATQAWQWSDSAVPLKSATPVFGTSCGPSLALAYKYSQQSAAQACSVALLNVAAKQIYHELSFHEAVQQVISCSAASVNEATPWFAVRTLSGIFTFDASSLQAVGAVRTWPQPSTAADSGNATTKQDCAAWGHLLACSSPHKPPSSTESKSSLPSVRQVVRFAASGVYTMAAAAAVGAAAAAPAVDAVRAAAGAALSRTTDTTGVPSDTPPSASHPPAAGYGAGSGERGARDAQQLHATGPVPRGAAAQAEEGSAGSVVLLAAPSGRPLVHWRAHSRPLACVAFAPSGRLLATTDEAGQTVKLWRLADSLLTAQVDGEEPPATPPQLLYELDRGVTHAVVSSIQFAEDESCVFVASERGTVHVFCIDPLSGGAPKPPVRVEALGGQRGDPRRHPAEALAAHFVRVVVPAYVIKLPDNPLGAPHGADAAGEHTVTNAAARVYLSDGLQPPPAPPSNPGSSHVRRSSADSSSSIASLNDARRAAVTPPVPPAFTPSTPLLSTCVVSHGGHVEHEDGSSPWQLLLEVWAAAVDHAAKLRSGTAGAGDEDSSPAESRGGAQRQLGPSGDQVPCSSTLQKAKLHGEHTLLTVLGGAAGLGTATPFALLSAHRVRTSVALGRFAATALQQQVSGAFLSAEQATPMLAGSTQPGDAASRPPQLDGVGPLEATADEGGDKGGYGYQPMSASSSPEPEAKPDAREPGSVQVQWGVHAAAAAGGVARTTVSPSAYPAAEADGEGSGSSGPVVLGVLPLPSLQRGVKGATHTATAVAAAMANTVQWASEAGSGSVAALSAAWGSAAGALRGAMGGPPPVPDTSHMSAPVTAASSAAPTAGSSPASAPGGSATGAHPRTRTASFLGATVGATWLAGDMARELRIRQGRWLPEDVHVEVDVTRRGAWWAHPWAHQVRDAVARSALPNSASPLLDSRQSPKGAQHSAAWRWWGGADWRLGAFGDVSCDPFFSGKGGQGGAAARLQLVPPSCFDGVSHSALLPGRSGGGGDPFAAPAAGPSPGSTSPEGVPAAVCWGAGGLVLSRVMFPLSAECRQLTPLHCPPGALSAAPAAPPAEQSANLAELWTSGIGADPAAVIALTRPSAPPTAMPVARDMRKSGEHLARGSWAHVAGNSAGGSVGAASDEGGSDRVGELYPAVPRISFSEDHFTQEGDAASPPQGTPPPSMALLAARLEASARAAGRAP